MVARNVVRRFTADEYERMAETGILRPDERLELLDGEIVCMAAMGSAHAACVRRSSRLLSTRLPASAEVSVQLPVRLSDYSEPEPDIAVLRFRPDEYAGGHPGPADVLLIIEVSHSSLRYDQRAKLPLYAGAGIPEVWLVDVERRRLLVHRSPNAGRYEEIQVLEPGGTVAPLAFPDLVLHIEEILG